MKYESTFEDFSKFTILSFSNYQVSEAVDQIVQFPPVDPAEKKNETWSETLKKEVNHWGPQSLSKCIEK